MTTGHIFDARLWLCEGKLFKEENPSAGSQVREEAGRGHQTQANGNSFQKQKKHSAIGDKSISSEILVQPLWQGERLQEVKGGRKSK